MKTRSRYYDVGLEVDRFFDCTAHAPFLPVVITDNITGSRKDLFAEWWWWCGGDDRGEHASRLSNCFLSQAPFTQIQGHIGINVSGHTNPRPKYELGDTPLLVDWTHDELIVSSSDSPLFNVVIANIAEPTSCYNNVQNS